MADVVVTDASQHERDRQARWRVQNPDKVKAKQSRWEQRHLGASAQKTKRYRLRHPNRIHQSSQMEKARHPGRRQAYKAVSYALKIGRLIKPDTCDLCHERKRLQAHHEDYTRPLDVQWICASCHKHLHLSQPASKQAGEMATDRRQRGEAHPIAKLDAVRVLAIRTQFVNGGVSKAALAREFGVTDVLIGKIIRREVWTHV